MKATYSSDSGFISMLLKISERHDFSTNEILLEIGARSGRGARRQNFGYE
jgi:hypothetical protein